MNLDLNINCSNILQLLCMHNMFLLDINLSNHILNIVKDLSDFYFHISQVMKSIFNILFIVITISTKNFTLYKFYFNTIHYKLKLHNIILYCNHLLKYNKIILLNHLDFSFTNLIKYLSSYRQSQNNLNFIVMQQHCLKIYIQHNKVNFKIIKATLDTNIINTKYDYWLLEHSKDLLSIIKYLSSFKIHLILHCFNQKY